MKVSDVYFIAASAAFDRLPAESLALIRRRDELSNAWGRTGYAGTIPAELVAARDAVAADPLASAAMQIRHLGNQAVEAEYRARSTNAAA